MKYEMIFGDETLFDGVRDGIVALRFVNGSGGKLLHCKEGQIDGLVEADLINHPIVAMRRIIKEPKRWTWEDKKAGRLPEVGSKFFESGYGEDEVIKITDNHVVSLRPGNHGAVSISKQLFFMDGGSIYPIETPEEKAARLRSEWCIKALSSCSILSEMQKYELKRLGGYIEDIYDALLSGDLPVPVKGAKNER